MRAQTGRLLSAIQQGLDLFALASKFGDQNEKWALEEFQRFESLSSYLSLQSAGNLLDPQRV